MQQSRIEFRARNQPRFTSGDFHVRQPPQRVPHGIDQAHRNRGPVDVGHAIPHRLLKQFWPAQRVGLLPIRRRRQFQTHPLFSAWADLEGKSLTLRAGVRTVIGHRFGLNRSANGPQQCANLIRRQVASDQPQ